jgi:hypothetical protein
VSGWTKLYSSLVTSSIWIADDATLRVWIAMLATADADGLVEGSIPGFANLARVSVEQMRAAIVTLTSPDTDSRTPDHEGRRVEPFAGGWRILNYQLYRDRPQSKDGSKAPAMRAYRARRAVTHGNALPEPVTHGNALPEPVTKGNGPSTRYPEERREKYVPPNPPNGGLSGSFDPVMGAQAGAFLRGYPQTYAKVRDGATITMREARDFPVAMALMAAYHDVDYLTDMLELFLRKADWAPKNVPGTIGQFRHLAPQCDAELRRHGWHRAPKRASSAS